MRFLARRPAEPGADGAVEHFPGRNPHAVMRIGSDGRLLYANEASEPILAATGIAVGEQLSREWSASVTAAAASGQPIELAVGPRTFELLVVDLPELGFANVYGTDVTAARLVDRFPNLNPHPVLRVAEDGEVRYANAASGELLDALAVRVGQRLPASVRDELFARLDSGNREPIEVSNADGTWALTPVRLPELGLINVYGTDITAQKAIVKFPDQNPHPVFRLDWECRIVYANPASGALLAGISGAVGERLADEIAAPLIDAAREGARRSVTVSSATRQYELLAVDVPEYGFINVYGTDVTAARMLEAAHRENVRLLLNVLPEPIADRLRSGESLIADRFDDVTLLFADIVDFTALSSDMQPDELVSVLNEVFSAFDGVVESAGLEKVKTIGDAYMVVGGLPVEMPDHAARVARVALALDERVMSIPAAHRLGLRFRVGIHSGPVVAGVIGTRKFGYDVWGDTVNVASRMESTGVPGRIQVTATVEERLRPRFRFEPRGFVDVKGKGPMPTFFLLGETR
ncbi:MAG: adenylate/guanylate cyclase domain-containing protein [Chloroflexota bacterium]